MRIYIRRRRLRRRARALARARRLRCLREALKVVRVIAEVIEHEHPG